MWKRTRDEELRERRGRRSVQIFNSFICLLASIPFVAIGVVGAIQGIRRGMIWDEKMLVVLLFIVFGVGYAIFTIRWHLRSWKISTEPDMRLPTVDELPPEDPRRRISTKERRRSSCFLSLGWLVTSVLCVTLAVLASQHLWVYSSVFVFIGPALLSWIFVHYRRELTGS